MPASPSWVHVVEIDPSAAEPPLQRSFLASLEMLSADAAAQVVRRQLTRWRVEDFFRVLNSGCWMESMAFLSVDRP